MAFATRVATVKWRWFIEVFRWRGIRHFDNMLNRISGNSTIALRLLVLRIYGLMSPDLSQLEQQCGYLGYTINSIPSGLRCWQLICRDSLH